MYLVERTNEQVLTIRHSDISAGWEQSYLLISDVHFDSPHCDRRLLTKHLQRAKERGAGILCFGDWFDAMGGRNDKRATKSTVRPDDSHDNYFDCLIDSSVDYLRPYADNLVMFSNGNHETAMLRHNETDLLERMTRQLGCLHMGYSGFVRLMFDVGGKKCNRILYYHHGSGGGGPVTKGTTKSNRRAASIEADIFVSGHIHEAWALENKHKRVNGKGMVEKRTQTHIQLPTYKEAGAWEEEKEMPDKPMGGFWLTFYADWEQDGRIGYRVERAN